MSDAHAGRRAAFLTLDERYEAVMAALRTSGGFGAGRAGMLQATWDKYGSSHQEMVLHYIIDAWFDGRPPWEPKWVEGPDWTAAVLELKP